MNDYNSVEGIEKYLIDLDSLNRLIKDRREAGYERKERLKEFYILGHWATDTCGNFGKIIEPTNGFTLLNKVEERDPYRLNKSTLTRAGLVPPGSGRNSSNSNITVTFEHDVPPAQVRCIVCKERWCIKNAHDAYVTSSSKAFPIDDFEGKKLSEAIAYFTNKTDALYNIQYESFLRNDRYIDLTPLPGYDTLVINKNGWAPHQDQNITIDKDNYIVQKGDELGFNVFSYYHAECHKIHKQIESKKYYSSILEEAGFTEYYTELV